MGLGLLAACTRTNPAFRIGGRTGDDADSQSPGRDGAIKPDHPPPPDTAAAQDLSDDIALTHRFDVASPSDLAPAGVNAVGLAARWRFDEGSGTAVADSSGNGNSGITSGGPTWASAGFPEAKFSNPGALVFDGLDDYVEITCKSIPASEAPKSVAAWFKPVNAAGVQIRNLVALTNDTSNVGIQLGLYSGRVAAWFYGYPDPLLQAATAVNGNWHHAAYTFDGKTHRIYYDGHLEMSVDRMPSTGPITHTRLGTYQVPDEMFAGTIDDARIYARALTDAEVTALWSGE
jgi:hypothetical protein